jgi:RNA polymerase sigma factor (sigma-70 family)
VRHGHAKNALDDEERTVLTRGPLCRRVVGRAPLRERSGTAAEQRGAGSSVTPARAPVVAASPPLSTAARGRPGTLWGETLDHTGAHMTPLPVPATARAVLTSAQEGALADAIRAGRRARLLAQRHLAARLRRELPPTVSARAAAGAVLAALCPLLPLAPNALPAVVGPLLPPALPADARARLLADLAAWPLDQDALRAGAAFVAAFVAANRGLVRTVAARYQHRGLLLDDLVQEGTVGLLRAIDLFDPARGYKFSTYAVWWIKQAIRRALATQVPLAHVPENVQQERAHLARQAHALHATLGHPPSRADLAAALDIPRARVDALTAPLPAPVPLDQTVGDAETTTLGDLLPEVSLGSADLTCYCRKAVG